MKYLTLLFGLILSTALQSAEIKQYDFFTGFSSLKPKQRIEAVNLFEKLPKEEKIKVLLDIYLDNDKLFKKHYYSITLIKSLKLISPIKSEVLENKIHEKIDIILDSVEKDPKIIYRVPWFTNRLTYYINSLPYVGLDGDRSFDAIFRFITLRQGVNDGLVALTLIPYKSDSDRILQLLEVLSYHKDYNNFSAALQYIKKVFKRYANEKNHAVFIKRLSQHIAELKKVKFEDNKGGRISYLKERIRDFEKMVVEYNKKYAVNKIQSKQTHYRVTNIHSMISSISPDNAVPTFHGNIPLKGVKRQLYDEKLVTGIFTKPQKVADIEYNIGLANVQVETSGMSKNQALYLLISNLSDQDKIINVSFLQTNAAGFIVDETNLTHNAIVGNSINTVIGTKLFKLSPQAKDINITLKVRNIEYTEPEIPLYKRAQMKSSNLFHLEFAFTKEIFKSNNNIFPHSFKTIMKQNQPKLKLDNHTKQICKNNYSVAIHRFWSDKTEDQYLLYSASCMRWDGECNDGHQRQILYKAPSTKNKKVKQLLKLVSKGNTFNTILSINDINNDGNIELSMNKNYCLSSSTSIEKLKKGKLIMLNKGANYSEGGYVDDPLYRTNPFVYSEI